MCHSVTPRLALGLLLFYTKGKPHLGTMLKALFFTATAAVFALCTGTYARTIAQAENAAAAAPLAAPFLLCAGSSMAAAACAGAALADRQRR